MEADWQELGVKGIKSNIEEKGHQEWREGMDGKNTVSWYRNKDRISRQE